ncbi:RNA polymerase sigma factor [Actinomadura nitritigenes]|uniref:RNA polymerase sigma factor n=1 Tax=Actinomadura nitritigenes TaxID=134602 RepID=UPI003D8A8020
MRRPRNGRHTADPDPRLCSTDSSAFTAFYLRHVDDVLHFVVRRVADPHLAADLTADVFVAVIESADSYRGGAGGPRAWLYGIARNVIASHARRASRQRDTEAKVAGRRLLDADDIGHLEERIDAAEEARRVYMEMAALHVGERAVLELIAVDGLTVTEAAAALGIRPVTARVRLHRARHALQAAAQTPDADPTTPIALV